MRDISVDITTKHAIILKYLIREKTLIFPTNNVKNSAKITKNIYHKTSEDDTLIVIISTYLKLIKKFFFSDIELKQNQEIRRDIPKMFKTLNLFMIVHRKRSLCRAVYLIYN